MRKCINVRESILITMWKNTTDCQKKGDENNDSDDSNASKRKARKSMDVEEKRSLRMHELELSLPSKVPSKRRITSQDWCSSRSINNEVSGLPSDFAFKDNLNDDDPNTCALKSFSESQGSSIFSNFNDAEDSLQSPSSSTRSIQSPSSSTRSIQSPLDNPGNAGQSIAVTGNTFCEPTNLDVLLGRGGLTNNHAGNIRYREEVEKVKPMYFSCRTKNEKKEVSELLVAYVQDYGGRFLEKDPNTKRWILASPKAARKKASQALRETKWKQSREKKDEKPG